MFAIHYFFESEKAIKTFLHNVSINLKEGDDHQASDRQETIRARTNDMCLRPAFTTLSLPLSLQICTICNTSAMLHSDSDGPS